MSRDRLGSPRLMTLAAQFLRVALAHTWMHRREASLALAHLRQKGELWLFASPSGRRKEDHRTRLGDRLPSLLQLPPRDYQRRAQSVPGRCMHRREGLGTDHALLAPRRPPITRVQP